MNPSCWTVVIFACLLQGCSTTYTVVEPSSRNPFNKRQFTDQVVGRNVTVELADGTQFDAILLRVDPDSCIWIDQNTSHSRAIRTKDIKRVEERDHFLGALEGIGFGTLCGGSIGGVIFAVSGVDAGDPPIGGGLAFLFGTVAGGLVGTVYGAVSGHLYEYEFAWFSKAEVSRDPTYGYSQSNPIKVGGMQHNRGPLNEREYLLNLRNAHNERAQIQQIGTCCPFDTPDSVSGGHLDMFRLMFTSTRDTIRLYLNMYEYERPKAPKGFRLAGSD